MHAMTMARREAAGSALAAEQISEPGATRLRLVALLCVGLMLVVVVASAWLRLAAPRPACADWPACRSQPAAALETARPHAADSLPTAVTAVVRGVHRVAASAVLVLIVVLCVLARRRDGGARASLVRRGAAAMLVVALALSALGIVTPGSRSTVVMLGNLLGGFVLFALAWCVWRAALASARLPPERGPPPLPPGLRAAALICALLWLVQAALGARSGMGGNATVSALHLGMAMLAGAGPLLIGLSLAPRGRRAEGRLLVAVVALQALGGLLSVQGDGSAPLVLLHNLTAALGLALLSASAIPALGDEPMTNRT